MSVYYISPSTIPTRSANSIHVVNMCEALTQIGYDVVLFVHSEDLNSFICKEVIRDFYGINNKRIEPVSYKSKVIIGSELGIAVYAFFRFINDKLRLNRPQYIISRNLYASVFLGILLRIPVLYETHAPERGFRKMLQKKLLVSSKVQTVVISEALRKLIQNIHEISNKRIHVFHDAARSGRLRMDTLERYKLQQDLLGSVVNLDQYDKVIGYFGHLYEGRGIEIIEGIAYQNPRSAFVVYGGNESEITYFNNRNSNNNMFFMGHISPDKVNDAMAMMDVLLMPYQNSVSIGIDGVDTAQWMSPMKMFEYMSTGRPIISSDLPVLREVLVDGENCLLVNPSNILDWSNALERIVESTELEEKLGANAYNDYKTNYTWSVRSSRMLSLFDSK